MEYGQTAPHGGPDTAPDPYRLRTELLGPLPVINHFLDRIGLAGSLERFVPHDDARLRLAPAHTPHPAGPRRYGAGGGG